MRLSQGQPLDRYLIGLHVRELRYICGVRQTRMQRFLGYAKPAMLSRREYGVIDFTAAELGAIAKLFDTPIAWFFEPYLRLPEPFEIAEIPTVDLANYNQEIIDRIVDLKLQRNITQADLAKQLGYSPATWTYIEQARRPIKGWELLSLAQYLDLEPRVLFKQGKVKLPNRIVAPFTKVARLHNRQAIKK